MLEDVRLIPGLRTGWAAARPDSQSVFLSLSHRSLPCTERPGAALDEFDAKTCLGGWSYAVDVPPELTVPGSYRLSDYELPRLLESYGPGAPAFGCDNECDRDPVPKDSLPHADIGPNRRLEIYNVSDHCITGRIWDPDAEPSESTADPSGAFHAVGCIPK